MPVDENGRIWPDTVGPGLQWDIHLPEKKLKDTSNQIMQALHGELSAGIRNPVTLQAAIARFGPTRIGSIALEYLAHIQICDGCHKWTYSGSLQPAYSGQQYVCPACLPQYEWCNGCESLKLRMDNVMHFHMPEFRDQLRAENRLQEFNFDIMLTGRQFRTAKDERRPRFRTPMYFGVELEVERAAESPCPPDLVLKAVRSLTNGFAIAKRDGSLRAAPGDRAGTNGLELVSRPATRAYHQKEAGWEKLFAALRPFCEERPPTAGLHFHVNSASVTPFTIAKLMKFINSPDNLHFLELVADRDFNAPSPETGRIYAPVAPEFQPSDVLKRREHREGCPMSPTMRVLRQWYMQNDRILVDYVGHPIIQTIDQPCAVRECHCPAGHYDYPNHYAALNLRTHKPTFEFRLFQASMNPTHFFACLEFCEALIYFCERTGVSGLNSEAFLQSLEQRQYPNLTKWLLICGLITQKKRKKKA